MAAIHKVVLIGASGTLGSAILRALQDNDDFEITVMSRTESQARFPENVKVMKTDYDRTDLERAFEGQHAVVCASGLGALLQQRIIVDACIATGVYRYITNDFGNPEHFQGLAELEFARKPKQDILKYVQQQADLHHTFTWTALATGHFLDYAIIKYPAFGFTLAEQSARLVDGGDEPFSSTTLDDIGVAVAGILRKPQETANRYLLVRTLETTQNEILTALEEQTGMKWSVNHISSGELREVGVPKIGQGDRSFMLDLLPIQIFEKGAGRSTLPKERYDNALLGVKEKSVNQVVHDILASI